MEKGDPLHYEDFLKKLKQSGKMIDKNLSNILSFDTESNISEAMKYAVLGGGKKIRGFLVLESCKLFNVPSKYAMNAASAIECMHTYSLIHDDLPSMDDDDFRRGKLTLHKKWNEATAILVGDGLQSLSYQILSETNTHPDPQIRLNLISSLSKSSGVFGMIEGQALDIEEKNNENQKDLKFISKLQKLKTGALIKWSALVGPIMDNSETKNLITFSDCLGLAFQIKDDILDLEGNEKEIGKKTLKDSTAGKVTFVSILGLEESKIKANQLVKEACLALETFGEKARTLKTLANFIIERKF